jgi:hypothetical protein
MKEELQWCWWMRTLLHLRRGLEHHSTFAIYTSCKSWNYDQCVRPVTEAGISATGFAKPSGSRQMTGVTIVRGALQNGRRTGLARPIRKLGRDTTLDSFMISATRALNEWVLIMFGYTLLITERWENCQKGLGALRRSDRGKLLQNLMLKAWLISALHVLIAPSSILWSSQFPQSRLTAWCRRAAAVVDQSPAIVQHYPNLRHLSTTRLREDCDFSPTSEVPSFVPLLSYYPFHIITLLMNLHSFRSYTWNRSPFRTWLLIHIVRLEMLMYRVVGSVHISAAL